MPKFPSAHPASTNSFAIDADSRPTSPNGPPGDSLALRALVTTKEAGIIIGLGGKNVANLRERTGVKAGVSKVVPGVHERVLSISGSVESIAKVHVNDSLEIFRVRY